METHRSLKTEWPGSILGGRQYFYINFFCNILFFAIFYNAVN